MSYMWNKFNIKTIPAETIVFCDGKYCPELSTLEYKPIIKKYDLPVHVIYVGEIDGNNNLKITVGVENQIVIVSANVKIKKPAFLNIFIKNAGKNSKISGTVLIENDSELKYNCYMHNMYENTAILIKNRVFAGKNSKNELSGTAIIDEQCPDCESDLGFVVMADKNAKLEFVPAQKIKSEPKSAEHSAAVFKPTDAQIFYLRGAGLSGAEVDTALKEAFLSFD
ncbi:MAG: SufD family Fe-S cluster assembly protein [Alphaproteobacteria bacterium]|nr:SufD family Fe-S cluster assembly protein [Alphaproteobacteria bacterium]